MRPGPNDPLLKRAELFIRRRVVRAFGSLVHRRSAPPTPADLSSAKVLLIRQDRIGDVLVSTPLIAALTEAHPALTIDILLSTNNVAARAGLPAIRRAWVYERTFASMLRLVRQIRKERYDVAIDLMDNPSATSTAFCVLSGARWTVGLEKENDYSYDIRVPLRSRRDHHIIERLSPFAEVFGLPRMSAEGPVRYQPSLPAQREARETFERLGIIGRPKVGVNISAGSERRYWGTERYRDLAVRLTALDPVPAIVFFCKPADLQRATTIAGDCPGSFVVPPSPAFDTFAATIAHLDALITPDTSVVHLASAFGIPSVVMYIQFNADLRIWEPYRAPHVPVITTVDDLSTITVDSVFAAWQSLVRAHPVESLRSRLLTER